MIIKEPIIKSLLDNDLYTITVGQIAFKLFPTSIVRYKFINRNRTSFPDNFLKELNHQLQLMKNCKFTNLELNWLKSLGYISNEYLQWLSDYQFDPTELTINQNNGELLITIEGSWVRTIMFEVPFYLISELYYKLTDKEKSDNWMVRIDQKSKNLSNGKCKWIDFGTRRRFSFDVQNEVVNTMKLSEGFLGTSNMFLAFKHNVKPNGTMSHQGPMAMMSKYGAENANRYWMKHWREIYNDRLLIYLTDTFTTDSFLKDFNIGDALIWDGLRQDSGNPYEWMDKVLFHYEKLGVITTNKKFIFSDSLTDEKYKQLSLKYSNRATIIGGIGTFFSNDCGQKPLNMVIKLVSANFGHGFKPTVKLSDDKGKHTGDSQLIQTIKTRLNIQ